MKGVFAIARAVIAALFHGGVRLAPCRPHDGARRGTACPGRGAARFASRG